MKLKNLLGPLFLTAVALLGLVLYTRQVNERQILTSEAFSRQSKNPFGLMLDAPGLTDSERVKIVKDLGAIYYRPHSVFVDKWDGKCTECQVALDAGLKLVLTVRNNGGALSPTTPPSNLRAYKQVINDIFNTYRPEILVVENEENSQALFYSGTVEEYHSQLKTACSAVRLRRMKCTNGGLVSSLIVALVADEYERTQGAAKANEYLRKALEPEEIDRLLKSANLKDQIKRGNDLLRGYKTAGADFVNFHWYAKPEAFDEAVAYVERMSGLQALTNEIGQHNDNPVQTRTAMQQVVYNEFQYAVWFSLDSVKARSLINPDGSLRPTGTAFKSFINSNF